MSEFWPGLGSVPWTPALAVSTAEAMRAQPSRAVEVVQAATEFAGMYYPGTVGRLHWTLVLEILGGLPEDAALTRLYRPGQSNPCSLAGSAASAAPSYVPPPPDAPGVCLGDLWPACPDELSPLAAVNTARLMKGQPRAEALAVRFRDSRPIGCWSWRQWQHVSDLLSGARTETEILRIQFPDGEMPLTERRDFPTLLTRTYDDRRRETPAPIKPEIKTFVPRPAKSARKPKAIQLSLFDLGES